MSFYNSLTGPERSATRVGDGTSGARARSQPLSGRRGETRHESEFSSSPGVLQGRSLRVRFNQEITAKTSAFEVLEEVQAHTSEYDHINFVTALHRIAKSGDGYRVMNDPAFSQLVA